MKFPPASESDRSSLQFPDRGTPTRSITPQRLRRCAAHGLPSSPPEDGLPISLKDRGAPLVQIPPDIQPARVTFGVVVASLLTMLESVGFLPEAGAWLESAAAQLRRRREELRRDDNAAERLAALLAGRHVLCQGDAPIGATAAERWKAQINQNARQAASASEQPNASHNEAVAWDSRNDLTMQREAAVLLRHGFEDPRVSQRIDRLGALFERKGSGPFRARRRRDTFRRADGPFNDRRLHLAPPCRAERRRPKLRAVHLSHCQGRLGAAQAIAHISEGSTPLPAIRPTRSQSA